MKERQTVPSEMSLQQEHAISRGSVRRPMELLREEGWAVTIQGRCTFRRPQCEPAEELLCRPTCGLRFWLKAERSAKRLSPQVVPVVAAIRRRRALEARNR
ncbi:hypothetical protein ABZ907_25025 [Nonomuraea wenchangensis]